jgi:tetratricopeptide (TPR) repeat protein
VSLAAQPVRGDGLGAAFDDANRLYEEGQYVEAIGAYAQILKGGRVSAALYFNLGNAHFKAGQLGKAILNYRLAERLAPRDPDIRSNLLAARTTVLGGAPPVPHLWRRLVSRLSLDEWTQLAAAALWLLAGLLVAGQWSPAWRPRLRRFVLPGGLVLFVVASGLWLTWRERCRPEVIVVQRDAILHHGPLDESPRLQNLRDGQELAVLDGKNGWLQVAGAARGIGWIRHDQVLAIGGRGQ